MKELTVIKIGGQIIDHPEKLQSFLKDFSGLAGHKVLVHGGGKLATRMAEQLGIPQQMVEGRRITDAETLRIVTMVYAGHINKNMVASLYRFGAPAIGLCGADGDLIRAHKREKAQTDYGFAGDIDQVNAGLLSSLLDTGHSLVLAPITHDAKGQLLNTNADTIATEVAVALGTRYRVSLVFGFEKPGVLRDVADQGSVIRELDTRRYAALRAENAIFAGMIPKLDNAFGAIARGVGRVVIGNAEQLPDLIAGRVGTQIR